MDRHPDNSNLRVTNSSDWEGLPLLPRHGPYVIEYLDNILMTLKDALEDYPRTSVLRFDLRLPSFRQHAEDAITRFFRSLKAQIDADQSRKAKVGRRRFPCRVRYVWAAERDRSSLPHYHVAILLNKDAYHSLGRFPTSESLGGDSVEPFGSGMADRIVRAWARALRLDPASAVGLVHFPDNAVYHINMNGSALFEQYTAAFTRLSYLAKARTKRYGEGRHSFRCSRPRLVPVAVDDSNSPRTQPIA